MRSSIAALLAALVACGGSQAAAPDPESSARLAALDKKVSDLDSRLAKIEDLLGEALSPPKEPDPAVVYAVPVEGDPFEGAADAKITVIKAFEFACGFCYRSRPTVEEMLDAYQGNIKVVYKYFVVHDQAIAPGLAVCAAHRQGKFSEMKDLIWDKGFAEEDLSPEHMKELALGIGLDENQFDQDVSFEGPCMEWLKHNHGTLRELGVRGTPGWYVNGRFVSGAQPFETFKALIDEEMVKADKAISGGVPVADYYLREVLAKGKTELE